VSNPDFKQTGIFIVVAKKKLRTAEIVIKANLTLHRTTMSTTTCAEVQPPAAEQEILRREAASRELKIAFDRQNTEAEAAEQVILRRDAADCDAEYIRHMAGRERPDPPSSDQSYRWCAATFSWVCYRPLAEKF
jgi:hypothetical protein